VVGPWEVRIDQSISVRNSYDNLIEVGRIVDPCDPKGVRRSGMDERCDSDKSDQQRKGKWVRRQPRSPHTTKHPAGDEQT